MGDVPMGKQANCYVTVIKQYPIAISLIGVRDGDTLSNEAVR